MPEVSLIVPCYNHGKYLHHALNSILNQTFSDWEAIVVDDGSEDNTRDVATSFADERFRYVYQKNSGVSAARNRGIGLASGEFMAFLDADDEWEPPFVATCVRELKSRENLDCVVTQAKLIDESGAPLPGAYGEHVMVQDFQRRLRQGGFFPLHCVLSRADVLRQTGKFDETLFFVEDWDLWLRILAGGGSMETLPEVLARYRILPGSAYTKVEHMHSAREVVLAKHFGAPEGDPASWPEDKRQAYALVHRTAALDYMRRREPEIAWHWMGEAAATWPGLLTRLDTYYELALGDQQRGYRGIARLLDIAQNGEDMLRGLDSLFAGGDPELQKLRKKAFGQARLALAMLFDQARDWRQARRHLLRAAWIHPPLLRDLLVLRRLVKLFVGARISDRIRAMNPGATGGRGEVEA